MGKVSVKELRQGEYPVIDAVISDINDHGEVHATFEEHDEEVELRLGTTTVDGHREQFIIYGADTEHYFSFDRLVSYYRPTDVYHD